MTLRVNARYLLILFLFHLLPLFAWDFALRNEIIEMHDLDQTTRFLWLNNEKMKDAIIELDQKHLVRLVEIVERYGWPGFSLVGKEGSHAFWLLAQHTPDFKFQRLCLTLLEKSVLIDEASPTDLAYLTDRVLIYEGKPQIFGTQLNDQLEFYPILEEETVDERRRAYGLSSLKEYLEDIRKIYGSIVAER